MGSVVKSVLPVAGSVVGGIAGTYFGAPTVGASIGGALGGALANGMGGDGANDAGPTGAHFNASGAPIQSPINQTMNNNANVGTQQGMDQQLKFLQAVQAQNGLQNQSNVFNQQQAIANGTGPNPAQAMLNNSTGANVANQAALMAGQRGSSANVGMMGRQIAQQGAATQQQAAGQGAALQANQSLGALNQMGGIAGQQAQMQAGATGANTQANQNYQQLLLNSTMGVNNANVGMQSNLNNVNAGISQHNSTQNGNMLGQLMGGIGSAANLIGGSSGGNTASTGGGDPFAGGSSELMAGAADNSGYNAGGMQMMATGGAVGPQSKVGQHFRTKGKPGLKPMMAEGGKVQALVSPGEVYLPPQAVNKVAKGADPINTGEKIPGKAKVAGNSYANDTVPKNLDDGGIVLPKSVMESKHPHWAAHRFVSEIMAKQGRTLPKKG